MSTDTEGLRKALRRGFWEAKQIDEQKSKLLHEIVNFLEEIAREYWAVAENRKVSWLPGQEWNEIWEYAFKRTARSFCGAAEFISFYYGLYAEDEDDDEWSNKYYKNNKVECFKYAIETAVCASEITSFWRTSQMFGELLDKTAELHKSQALLRSCNENCRQLREERISLKSAIKPFADAALRVVDGDPEGLRCLRSEDFHKAQVAYEKSGGAPVKDDHPND